MLREHLLKLDTCFIRVKHGFWQGSSLKLTSSFTRRGVTEEVRANGLIEEDSGYHALLFLIFLQIFSCDVIIYQRQWGVILIHEQCLPKKKKGEKNVYLCDLYKGITWETSLDECAGKMSVPANCGFSFSADRALKPRNWNLYGSPCAVNRPIDIVQKRRR